MTNCINRLSERWCCFYCIRALKEIYKDSGKMVSVNVKKTIQHRFAVILEIKWLLRVRSDCCMLT